MYNKICANGENFLIQYSIGTLRNGLFVMYKTVLHMGISNIVQKKYAI